jgi:hypothetical protein
MSEISAETIWECLSRAELDGWAGQCGPAAIAINRVLLGGKGTYIVAYNKGMMRRRNHFVGHVAVRYGGFLWDAEGQIEPDDLEAWGMLAPDDLDYRKQYGRGWSEEIAEGATVKEVDEAFLYTSFHEFLGTLAALESALRKPQVHNDGGK